FLLDFLGRERHGDQLLLDLVDLTPDPLAVRHPEGLAAADQRKQLLGLSGAPGLLRRPGSGTPCRSRLGRRFLVLVLFGEKLSLFEGYLGLFRERKGAFAPKKPQEKQKDRWRADKRQRAETLFPLLVF